MAHQNLLAIVNAGAGSASETRVDAALSVLKVEATVADVELDIAVVDDIPGLQTALADVAGKRLVVLGGDGTLHAVVQHLHEVKNLQSVGSIAIVPLGTGNDLATHLGVPSDPAEAARIAVHGTSQPLELLVAADGRVTVNAVHVGIGAVAAVKGHSAKQWLGRVRLGRFGYRLGTAAAGLSERGTYLEVIVDGQVLHDGGRPVLMVAMGLGATVGGGAPLVPAANPHDGLIDVVVSLASGPLARVGYARKLRDGTHVNRDDVLTARGRAVEVNALNGSDFLSDGDGEVLGPFTSRKWVVEGDAWQVVVPPSTSSQSKPITDPPQV